MYVIVYPLCLAKVLVGSFLTLIVIAKTELRKTTISIYLVVLTIVDALYISTGFPIFVLRLQKVRLSPCKWCLDYMNSYFYTLLGATAPTSSWILVAMTTTRFTAAVYPLHVKRLCSKGKTFACLLSIVFLHF